MVSLSDPHSFVPKVWGTEEWIVNSDYCGKILRLSAGMRCSLHRHLIKDETFYVQSGIVLLESGEFPDALELCQLGHGDSTRIPPLTWHRFSSHTGATIIEFSTHHEDFDVERAEPSGRTPTP